MQDYVTELREVLSRGYVPEDVIKKHVAQHAMIDTVLPETPSFFYVLELKSLKYRFMGRQQYNVSGYTNEEVMEKGVEFFVNSVHPDDIGILLNEVYPAFVRIIEEAPIEERRRAQVQYNYRFRIKSGEYQNLVEQTYVLELDNMGSASLFLGHVTVLLNQEVLPVRFACRRINDAGVAETFYHKTFAGEESLLDRVTPREMDILRNLAMGKKSREIADELYISKHTVDTHRRNLLKKLECKSTVDLAQLAFANGLL